MTTQQAADIIKMLLGYLKGELEPPKQKTIEEAKAFEQQGYECLKMAIRSLEADRKMEKILYDIRNEITMLFIFDRQAVIEIIDKHLKEVEDDTGRA